MLIPVRALAREFGVRPRGVLHLGANVGEEAMDYVAAGWAPVWWVEGRPDAAQKCRDRVRRMRSHHVIEALVAATDDAHIALNVASNGESSSALPLGTHAREHPEVTYTGEVVRGLTSTVDSLCDLYDVRADFLNLDLQGFEGEALAGAQRFLRYARWVYSEVNERELYEGCVLLPVLDDFLEDRGYERVATEMTRHGWGDALYARAT